jgi:dUTP pyrophosphatase
MTPIVNMNTPELLLKMYVSPEQRTLREFYRIRIEDHNSKINDEYADSGFDLGLPKDFIFSKAIGNKVPLDVHTSMWDRDKPQAYYLYPRSSISKTPMRMSNSLGIIDKGYRGPLTAMVDIIEPNIQNYPVSACDRYFQICHPSLNFFKVIMVDTQGDLGVTERGNGGFGSTGI